MDDLPSVPLSDHNMWYYPSHGHDSDEEDLSVGSKTGNWGCKTAKGARWVRRGKITPWGPGMEDWEVRIHAFFFFFCYSEPCRPRNVLVNV